MVLASRFGNKLPACTKWIRELNIRCDHFLSPTGVARLHCQINRRGINAEERNLLQKRAGTPKRNHKEAQSAHFQLLA
jgi:hypothetical protein